MVCLGPEMASFIPERTPSQQSRDVVFLSSKARKVSGDRTQRKGCNVRWGVGIRGANRGRAPVTERGRTRRPREGATPPRATQVKLSAVVHTLLNAVRRSGLSWLPAARFTSTSIAIWDIYVVFQLSPKRAGSFTARLASVNFVESIVVIIP